MGTRGYIEQSGGRRVRKAATRTPKVPRQSVDQFRAEIAWHFAAGAKRVLVYVTRSGRWAIEHDATRAGMLALEQVLALPAAGGVAGLYTHTPPVDVLREDLGATR